MESNCSCSTSEERYKCQLLGIHVDDRVVDHMNQLIAMLGPMTYMQAPCGCTVDAEKRDVQTSDTCPYLKGERYT